MKTADEWKVGDRVEWVGRLGYIRAVGPGICAVDMEGWGLCLPNTEELRRPPSATPKGNAMKTAEEILAWAASVPPLYTSDQHATAERIAKALRVLEAWESAKAAGEGDLTAADCIRAALAPEPKEEEE